MPEISASEWEAFMSNHPDAHLLQTRLWGDLKSSFGWRPAYVLADAEVGNLPPGKVGAQVLFRRLPLGFSLAYIPKGPVSDLSTTDGFSGLKSYWDDVDHLCRKARAIFLKVEPDLWRVESDCPDESGFENVDEAGRHYPPPPGFRPARQNIQPPRTLVVDLGGSEEQVLGQMKQKTRYNVRLALKKGVVVYPSDDLEAFYRLMTITGKRDAFGVHSLEYYRRAYEIFNPKGECVLLMAEFQGTPLAAIMVFAHGRRAWYFYGASSDENRERMPTYLLQWEGMRWARSRGCSSYDLWGVPDADLRTLEAGFEARLDGLWGVYRFKRGFGGELRRAVGPWDRVYNPFLYLLYRWWSGFRSTRE
jgi:peptidoglycan pentaglycine glycine transferase (the first glycine)